VVVQICVAAAVGAGSAGDKERRVFHFKVKLCVAGPVLRRYFPAFVRGEQRGYHQAFHIF